MKRWLADNPNADFWYNTALEKHIDALAFDQRYKSCDKLPMGTILSKNSINRLHRKFQGILSHCPNKLPYIRAALRITTQVMKDYLFEPHLLYRKHTSSVRREITATLIKKVTKFNNISAFILLTTWAIEVRNKGRSDLSFYCALALRNLFPSAICQNPQLFIQWRLLTGLYMHRIWSIQYGSNQKTKWIEIDTERFEQVVKKGEAKARSNGIMLPPKPLMERLGKKFRGPFVDSLEFGVENDDEDNTFLTALDIHLD